MISGEGHPIRPTGPGWSGRVVRKGDEAVALPQRLRVVVPGFLLGTALSVFLGLKAAGSQAFDPLTLLICFGPLAGPFSEPLGRVDYDAGRMIGWGGILMLLIALHPLRPRRWTAVVSGLVVGVWFVSGLCWTYDGV
jgi:hypothetical protein